MLKVMTIVGTRPEIIRLSRVIELFDRTFDHILVHTGQNFDYELSQVFFDDLGIRKPDLFLEAAGSTAAVAIGQIIIAADNALTAYKPDAVLILGDTNSCLAAISAKRKKIPIFHMEAGNRCFDFRVPEEINRRIVDVISDINLTYSNIARQYLLREGFPEDQVIKTGSPMREVLEFYQAKIRDSTIHKTLGLRDREYFLVSAHREETVDDETSLRRLFGILESIADTFGQPIIVSTHPRTRKRIDALGVRCNALIQFHKPFGFFDYNKLQMEARTVLSDSGTITEESSILDFPALNIRDVHERPEGFEEAAVMMVGLNIERIREAIAVLDSKPRGTERSTRLVQDYTATNVSEKIMRIIISYTDFVNRRVWRKPL